MSVRAWWICTACFGASLFLAGFMGLFTPILLALICIGSVLLALLWPTSAQPGRWEDRS